MKFFALGGVPCSGKTTIAKRFIERNIKDGTPFQFGKLRGIFKGDLIVLGIYDDTRIFSGTDRLSMAVQPDFIKWLNTMLNYKDKWDACVFFEGDRLFTASVLKILQEKVPSTLSVVIDISEKERLRRKALRKDTQTEKFIQSRRTKYENIIKLNLASRIFHENPEDTQYMVERIEDFFCLR